MTDTTTATTEPLTITCASCGAAIAFERHPADWPNHPDGVRVKVECPECGATTYTDGITEVEYVEQRTAELRAQIADEVAARLNAENGAPVDVTHVSAGDGGGGDDHAASG